MVEKDLTIIFLTVNKLPKKWVAFHRRVLLKAARGYDIITVSRLPMPDMPGLNIIQQESVSASNIYWQMLRAAKLATTKYVAVAEDDSLYHPEHFRRFRPGEHTFAYNMTRWSLFTWGEPTYHWKDRISNLTLICSRTVLIKALEERFNKYPEGTPHDKTGELGKWKTERQLGLPHYDMVKFQTTVPVVNLNHTESIDLRENRKVKRMGKLRSYDIPYWRKAEDIIKHFHD